MPTRFLFNFVRVALFRSLVIITERCILSSPSAGDSAALIRLYTDPTIRLYLGGPLDEATAASRVNKLLRTETPDQAWVIREKGSQAALGLVTIDSHHDGKDYELSYLLLPEYHGQGYATEALRSVIHHAFTTLGLSRLVSETQMANAPSRRLLERLGMKLDRTVFRFGVEQGIYCIEGKFEGSEK